MVAEFPKYTRKNGRAFNDSVSLATVEPFMDLTSGSMVLRCGAETRDSAALTIETSQFAVLTPVLDA